MNPIREKRIKLGLTQAELAKILEVDRTTIAKWETDKSYPKVKMLLKVSKALGLPLKELVNVE